MKLTNKELILLLQIKEQMLDGGVKLSDAKKLMNFLDHKLVYFTGNHLLLTPLGLEYLSKINNIEIVL